MIKYETDSRKIIKGQTFVAIKGNTVDGHDYIQTAIDNGCQSIVVSKKVNFDIPTTIVSDAKAFIQEAIVTEYKEKFKDITFIGVTGTNGKTTTCYLTYQLLQNLNCNVAYIGTIGFYHKDLFIELENTTPDILNLYKLLDQAIELGVTHIVMEVSSHALSFKRIEGLEFTVGAFTNLTQDHLDYHETMDNYLNEKLKLINYLKNDGIMIINQDDSSSSAFITKSTNYKTIGTNSDYNIIDYNITAGCIDLNFEYENIKYNSLINLTSKFNVYNYITALAIINNIGYSIENIIQKATKIKPPKGRCETIKVNNGFAVIDYAHTPDAVEKVITAYNELKTNKVITIIGCGGDRDPKKRPIMGKIASDLSDYVIFTNDNPRTEDEKNIMKDILNGIKKDNYEVIYDRKEAIKKGVEILKNEDILLILGKGHEDYQIIGHTKYHLDDAEEVKKYIRTK